MKYKNIGIIASKEAEAIEQKKHLIKKYDLTDCYNNINNKDIDLLIALGGDGLILHLLHEYQHLDIPIYGINYGTIGFLMNSLSDNIMDSINSAKLEKLYPLKMIATDIDGKKHQYFAINEVSLLRQSNQAAKIKIEINNKTRIENLICDGILVATPAGSTAYNLSVNGPIIPFGADILTMTPISPFRPRSWRGALLSDKTKIKFTILKHEKRPISATADYFEVRNVKEVEIAVDKSQYYQILFDPNHSLEERIIKEQFI
jgi:NAD+ kinase